MRVVIKLKKRGERIDKHEVATYSNRKFPTCKRWCHKAIPTLKNENANGWEKPCWETQSNKSSQNLFGPASCKETRMIFYPCNREGCWLGCPCFHCRGYPIESLDAAQLFSDHHQYHHARHLSCNYCDEIFRAFPAYSYDAFIDVYGDWIRGRPVRSMKSIPHKSFILYHNNFFVKLSDEMELHCDECDQVFTKKKNKYRHMRAVHLKSRTFKCSECEKSFPYDNMERHRIEVHDPDPLEERSSCNHCGTRFSNVDNKFKHADDSNQTVFTCQACNKDFCNSTQLKMHMKKEHLECTICKETFSRKSYLQAHVSRKKSECLKCNQTFCNKRQLILHNVKCIIAEKHHCEQCEKTFTTASNKSRHMKTTHLRAKSFNCKDCDKDFDRIDVLMKHRTEVHSTEPYFNSCNHCQSTFTKYESWLKHVEANYNDEGQTLNKCSECEMDFCNPTQLKQHMNKSHLECSECKTVFSKRANLIAHMKRAVMCGFCSITFCNPKHLLFHKKGAHSNLLQCEKCELLFDHMEKLEKHREKHD